MPSTRRSYHSDLKIAVQLDILPSTFVRSIPRSSMHRFRKSDYSNLVGSELSQVVENLDPLKEVAKSRAALKTAGAVLRIASFTRSLGLPLGSISTIKIPALKESVVDFVERLSDMLPRKRILRLLGLSPERFRAWARGKYHCPSSPLDRCRKTHPHQLTVSELRMIRKAFKDPMFSSWPASSIAWKLVHEGALNANVRTITGYAKLLGLRNDLHIRKSRKRGSLTSSKPNEAWHLDATVMFTSSHERAYLQFVLDNYSKKIIAWRAGPSISGMHTTELLKDAFASLSGEAPGNISLIVDGGSENNNSSVSAFIEGKPIRKLIAKVDVSFSNSMIEAVNKILKYQYIFRETIPDLEHLKSAIMKAINDYNNRPHYALFGLTPNQVYAGMLFDKAAYRERIVAAREARIGANRRACSPCVPFDLENEEE